MLSSDKSLLPSGTLPSLELSSPSTLSLISSYMLSISQPSEISWSVTRLGVKTHELFLDPSHIFQILTDLKSLSPTPSSWASCSWLLSLSLQTLQHRLGTGWAHDGTRSLQACGGSNAPQEVGGEGAGTRQLPGDLGGSSRESPS